MLALWFKPITLHIEPQQITLVQSRGWGKWRKVIEKKSLPITLDITNKATPQAIVNTIDLLLAKHNIKNARLEIMLSDQFVRVDLLPATRQALKPAEQQKRAQLHFERIYGAMAQSWAYCYQPQQYDTPTLVAAIDANLLNSLQEAALAHQCQLVKVEPALVGLLNHYKKLKLASYAWLIIIGHDLCSIVQYQQHQLVAISQHPIKETLTADHLYRILNRQALQQGQMLTELKLHLIAPQITHLSLKDFGLSLQRVTPTVRQD